MAADWMQKHGEPSVVLTPDDAIVAIGTRMCCPEHGLRRVIVLGFSEDENAAGPAWDLAFDLDPETARQLGESLIEGAARL